MSFWSRFWRGDREATDDVNLYGGLIGAAIISVVEVAAPDVAKVLTPLGVLTLLVVLGFALWQRSRRSRAVGDRKSAGYGDEVAAFRKALADAPSASIRAFFKTHIQDLIQTIHCGEDYRPEFERGDFRLETLVAHTWPNLQGEALAERVAAVRERMRLRATLWSEGDGVAPPHLEFRVNTPHALAFDVPSEFTPEITGPKCINADYIALLALRDAILQAPANATLPHTVGAGGFIVDPDNKSLFHLFREGRVAKGAVKPEKSHVFGGNLEPDLGLQGRGFDKDLRVNAQREILEEAGFSISVEDCLCVTHRERFHHDDQTPIDNVTAWLSTYYCGVILPRNQRAAMRKSVEGQVKEVRLSDLHITLRQPQKWVPLGWYTIMLWLYLGAPCQGGEPVLSRREARRLFDRVLAA